MNQLAPRLIRQEGELAEGEEPTGHYIVDEKTRQIELTEIGHQFIEEVLTTEGLLQKVKASTHHRT